MDVAWGLFTVKRFLEQGKEHNGPRWFLSSSSCVSRGTALLYFGSLQDLSFGCAGAGGAGTVRDPQGSCCRLWDGVRANRAPRAQVWGKTCEEKPWQHPAEKNRCEKGVLVFVSHHQTLLVSNKLIFPMSSVLCLWWQLENDFPGFISYHEVSVSFPPALLRGRWGSGTGWCWPAGSPTQPPWHKALKMFPCPIKIRSWILLTAECLGFVTSFQVTQE